jgi:hypothetical protein
MYYLAREIRATAATALHDGSSSRLAAHADERWSCNHRLRSECCTTVCTSHVDVSIAMKHAWTQWMSTAAALQARDVAVSTLRFALAYKIAMDNFGNYTFVRFAPACLPLSTSPSHRGRPDTSLSSPSVIRVYPERLGVQRCPLSRSHVLNGLHCVLAQQRLSEQDPAAGLACNSLLAKCAPCTMPADFWSQHDAHYHSWTAWYPDSCRRDSHLARLLSGCVALLAHGPCAQALLASVVHGQSSRRPSAKHHATGLMTLLFQRDCHVHNLGSVVLAASAPRLCMSSPHAPTVCNLQATLCWHASQTCPANSSSSASSHCLGTLCKCPATLVLATAAMSSAQSQFRLAMCGFLGTTWLAP